MQAVKKSYEKVYEITTAWVLPFFTKESHGLNHDLPILIRFVCAPNQSWDVHTQGLRAYELLNQAASGCVLQYTLFATV